MILILDNYDSFTYNLVQSVRMLGRETTVVRNDAATVEALAAMNPTHLIVSPGPGRPADAGVSIAAIQYFAGRLPILGVCLGHQAIGEAFGGRVVRAGRLMHGKSSQVLHDGVGLYAGLPQPFQAARYHSLIVEEADLPAVLEARSRTAEGELMGLRHREFAVEGVQFHPESFLTEQGQRLMQNFLELIAPKWDTEGGRASRFAAAATQTAGHKTKD